MSVRVFSTYTVSCDGPGCSCFIRGTESRAAARRSARKRGWVINVDKMTRTGGNDYCEAHAGDTASLSNRPTEG